MGKYHRRHGTQPYHILPRLPLGVKGGISWTSFHSSFTGPTSASPMVKGGNRLTDRCREDEDDKSWHTISEMPKQDDISHVQFRSEHRIDVVKGRPENRPPWLDPFVPELVSSLRLYSCNNKQTDKNSAFDHISVH